MHRKAAIQYTVFAGAFLSAMLVLVCTTDKFALHTGLNRMTRPGLDYYFAVGTHLADGWVAVGFGLICLLIRWRWFLLVAVSVAGSAIVAQSLKHLVFADADRPSMFMSAMPDLRLIPGVEMLHHNSFPSGHSTCAFSLCFALSIIIARPWAAIALALFAGILASTRVYLSQHFTEDVLAGAALGVATGVLMWFILYRSSWSRAAWLGRRPWPTGHTA